MATVVALVKVGAGIFLSFELCIAFPSFFVAMQLSIWFLRRFVRYYYIEKEKHYIKCIITCSISLCLYDSFGGVYWQGKNN